MDCKYIEELLPAYALNALGEEEASLVEKHLDGCPWCPALLREHLLVTASLSLLAEPSEPPRALKEKTMRRAAKELRHRPEPWRRFSFGSRLALAGAASLAVAALATVIALNIHMTIQLDDLDRENSRLAGQVLSLASEEQSLRATLLAQMESVEQESSRLAVQLSSLSKEDKKLSDMLMEQRSMNYIMAAPDRQVYSLQANETEARAEGMLMVALKSGRGVLVAKGLKPSSGKRGYYVWLRKDGERIAAGHLTVDETGWGTLTLWPEQPITVFQHIWVTEDDGDEAAKPVLWGSIVPR